MCFIAAVFHIFFSPPDKNWHPSTARTITPLMNDNSLQHQARALKLQLFQLRRIMDIDYMIPLYLAEKERLKNKKPEGCEITEFCKDERRRENPTL